ncbi:efflux RND transporter periplasmic adaptor subunit, partial [Candidatus Frankia alpina]
SGDSDTSVSARLVAAGVGQIRQTVSATGTVEPTQQANLSFAVSGEVTAVKVAVGDKVQAGQTLATIDSAALATAAAQAKATVANDQAKVTSDQTAGVTGTQLTADETTLTSAQDAAATAQRELAASAMTSPIAGTVAAVNLTVGQRLAGGSASTTGGSGSGGLGGNGGGTGSGASSSASSASGAQLVVVGTDSYLVNATVDDTAVGQLKTGDQAVITPTGTAGSTTVAARTGASSDAGTGLSGAGGSATIYGTVATIGLIATSTSGVASYPVTINITGAPSGLHPGAGADISIIVRQLSDVLTVPSQALHTSGSRTVVYQMHGGHQVSTTVTTGVTSRAQTQITSGLVAGDQVVVAVAGGSTTR